MAIPAQKLLTYGEYLALEIATGSKHEFVDGIAYAMAGGTFVHNVLSATISRLLYDALRGRPCLVHSSDQRVRIPATGRAFYPDASVSCGGPEAHPEDPDALVNPTVIVEVLSPSTEHHDRVFKLAEYCKLASATTVLLVSTDREEIQRWRRDSNGEWGMTVHGPGHTFGLVSLDSELSVDDAYADARDLLGRPAE